MEPTAPSTRCMVSGLCTSHLIGPLPSSSCACTHTRNHEAESVLRTSCHWVRGSGWPRAHTFSSGATSRQYILIHGADLLQALPLLPLPEGPSPTSVKANVCPAPGSLMCSAPKDGLNVRPCSLRALSPDPHSSSDHDTSLPLSPVSPTPPLGVGWCPQKRCTVLTPSTSERDLRT